jgi:uncharacterized delta-60 repeat protein
MTVWRFDSTGAPVNTFGTSGVKSYTDNPAYTTSRGNAILVDASAKILVAGTSTAIGGTDEMTIWRLSSTGVLDAGFNGGVASIAYGDVSQLEANADLNGISMALVDPNDATSSILVTGTATTDTTSRMILWKCNAAGGSVGTFGGYDGITDGVLVYTGSSGSNHAGYSITLAVPSDTTTSDILVTGYYQSSSSTPDMAMWRIDATGHDLAVVTNNNAAGGNGDDEGFFITTDTSTGDIFITGKSANAASGYDMVIWKYTSAGAPDTTFGLGGYLVDNSAAGGNYWANGTSLAIVPESGKLIVAGCSLNSSTNLDMVLWQYYQ